MTSLIAFYALLIILIILLKKILHIKIIINGIWFSDGTIPDDVITNFLELAQKIKKSPYYRQYDLYFWTDLKKINSTVKKQFRKNGITIKDYRDIHFSDESSKIANEWIDDLLKLKNKVGYVLASDLFRLYLLFKEFPRNYQNKFTCYIDCNDICINEIPNPRVFLKLKFVAFHFLTFTFAAHTFAKKIITDQEEVYSLLTNDVIVAANKNNSWFDTIFESYCNNFKIITQSTQGIIELLTLSTSQIINDELIFLIIFSTTHIINTLYYRNPNVYLLAYSENDVKKIEVPEVMNVADFINFERDYSKGFTYLTNEATQTTVNEYQEFWTDLFMKRYAKRMEKIFN